MVVSPTSAGTHHQAPQHDSRVVSAKWRHHVGYGHGGVVLHHHGQRIGALELASAAEFLVGADCLSEHQRRVHAHPERIQIEAGLQVGASAAHQGNRRPVHHVADRDAPLAFAEHGFWSARFSAFPGFDHISDLVTLHPCQPLFVDKRKKAAPKLYSGSPDPHGD